MRLKIGHRTYTVRRMEKGDVPPKVKNAVGYHDGGRGLILLSGVRTHQPDDHADTLIHEVLHAIWYVLDVPDAADEETVVTRLAHGLTQVIRDNPQFIAAVQAGLDGSPLVAPQEPTQAA